MRTLVVGLAILGGCGSKKDPSPDQTDQPPPPPRAADAAAVAATDAPSPVVGPDNRPPADPDCATTCNEASDCPPSQCACEDGHVTTARSCVNRCCQGTSATCGGICDDHDGMKGTWNEQREGGKQTGKACKTDDDCAKRLCYRGYCTRSCDSESDCPPFWECNELGQTRDQVCTRR